MTSRGYPNSGTSVELARLRARRATALVGDSFYGSLAFVSFYSWVYVMIYVIMCTYEGLVCPILFQFSPKSDIMLINVARDPSKEEERLRLAMGKCSLERNPLPREAVLVLTCLYVYICVYIYYSMW